MMITFYRPTSKRTNYYEAARSIGSIRVDSQVQLHNFAHQNRLSKLTRDGEKTLRTEDILDHAREGTHLLSFCWETSLSDRAALTWRNCRAAHAAGANLA